MVKIFRVGAVALLSICATLLSGVPSHAATPALSINDVTVTEPNWPDWEAPAVFTVSLNRSATKPVTVHWTTSVPLNTWDPEIKPESGTITIPAGEQQGTLTVTVLRETSNDDDRQFTVTLSGATNANIADGVGVGTIVNTDRAGRFSCRAEGGQATALVGSTTYYRIPPIVGYDFECNYPDARASQSVSQTVAGVTFTAKALDVSVTPTPKGNYSWDTRVNVGDGGDAHAKTGVVTISAQDVDIRLETARSHARIRCETVGAPPVMSGTGAVTGVTINGTTIDQVTDHRVYELGPVKLEFNRPRVNTDSSPLPFTRLTHDAVAITVAVNNVTLVLGRAQVGYAGEPCST